MLDLNKLNQFHVLASVGSYAKAALVLNVTQPSLTRAIQALERQYGVRLIERSRGQTGLHLTDPGLELFTQAGQLLQESASIERRLRGADVRGELLAFGLGPVLATMLLRRVYPQLVDGTPELQSRVLVSSAPALLESLLSGAIEFYLGHVPLGAGVVRRVRQEFFGYWPRPGLWVAPDHPLLSRPHARLRDIARYPRLSTTSWVEGTSTIQDDEVRAILESTISIDDHAVLIDLTSSTDGVLISILDNSATGLVRLSVPLAIERIAVTINVVSIRGAAPSPRATAMLEALRQAYEPTER